MQNRADLSQFLIHLTKDGTFSQYSPLYNGFKFAAQTVQAEPSLERIIQFTPNPQILARSPYGYFKMKIDYPTTIRGGVRPDWINTVCFSETPLHEIKSFYKSVAAKRNQYKKYGLAFWTETIRSKGGNPVFYVDSRKTNLINSLDQMLTNHGQWKELYPYFETFGPQVLYPGKISDFRWEREWRLPGDLNFNLHEIAFGICPEDKIPKFEELTSNQIVFIDPDWDMQYLRNVLINKKAVKLLEAI